MVAEPFVSPMFTWTHALPSERGTVIEFVHVEPRTTFSEDSTQS
jgi:hypothetical protein